MATTELRIAGFGGQGVILAGIVIGKAAAIYDGKHATLTQSFGPEARGSACSAQLVLSDQPILYPYLTALDILVAMSQDAYHRFGSELQPGGLLLVEAELVTCHPRPDGPPGIRLHGIPATRLAEELGRRAVSNIVMVGFLTAMTGLVSVEAIKQAIADSVPRGTEAVNLAAFEKGLEYGLAHLPTQPALQV
ncbi:MAG TPA: 2-oxoacid:acceptor oxidoreductase family protein [Candidatus Acidoferrales bacterium]